MLEGQSRILISGGGQGIGQALARHFASRGHKIFILDLNEDNVQHTAEEHLKEHSDRVGWSKCDLRSVDEIRSTIAKAVKFLDNRVDYLNNAGISNPYWPDGKKLADPSVLDKWQAYVETNLTGPFVMSQACISYMKVVKKEDTQKLPKSKFGTAGPCINSSGLSGLTQSMAVSLQIFGIRVNMVSPGRIKVTHGNPSADEQGEESGVEDDDIETHPANRAGLPEDITEACEYLIGAGFVTGQNLIVEGGMGKVKGKA